MEFLKYNNTGAIIYTASGWVKMVDNCNGYLAVNRGTSIVRVNDHILYPGVPGTSNGDTLPVGGNFGEIYKGTIKISFDPGGINELSIDQKFYILPKPIV